MAVLNFVFGGLGAIFSILAFLAAGAASALTASLGGDAPGVGILYMVAALSLLSSVSLIVAGVGYLGMKKMGRMMGNVYVGLALISTVLGIALAHSGFGVGTIIGLIYPILTAILINTTWKGLFVN